MLTPVFLSHFILPGYWPLQPEDRRCSRHVCGQVPPHILLWNATCIKPLSVLGSLLTDLLSQWYVWSTSTVLWLTYFWITAALLSDGDYTCHLRTEELDAGIRRGSLIQGIINVNKHNAQNEAFVRPSGLALVTHTVTSVNLLECSVHPSRFLFRISGKSWQEDGQDILILGTVSRNRAIHGDVVCVELLPKKMWQPRSRDLKENQVEGQSQGGFSDPCEFLDCLILCCFVIMYLRSFKGS